MSPTSQIGAVLRGLLGALFLLALLPAALLANDQKPQALAGGQSQAAATDQAKPTTPPENALSNSLSVPADPKTEKLLEAVRTDYLKKGAWKEAAQILQPILAAREDLLVPVRSKGAKGEEVVRWVGARAEADRLLRSMPPEGLKIYQQLYGPEAHVELMKEMDQASAQLPIHVALRYFQTDSGTAAVDQLGTSYFEHGQPFTAALWYDRLLKGKGAAQLTPFTLFKATVALRKSGDPDHARTARATWDQLAAKVERRGLRVGEEVLSLEQLRQEVDKADPLRPWSDPGWRLFRGNAARSASARGNAPDLRSTWHDSMLVTRNPDSEYKIDGDTEKMVEVALDPKTQRGIRIPAFYSITASGRVFFRSYWGIHARDLKTGELGWDSNTAGSLNAMLTGDGDQRRLVLSWFSMYHVGGTLNVLFENSTTGSLSADDAHVYAVDDLALPPHPNAYELQMMMWGNGGMQIQGALHELADRSRLVAIEIKSGKLVWERGDPKHDIDARTANCYYLGPPLSLGGMLYVLTEKNSELRLLCLEPSNGQPLWAQTLASIKDKMLMDQGRRVQAVHLAYADGILVCPTNAGALLGVDLLTHSVIWAFPYREKPEEPTEQEKMIRKRFGGKMPHDWTKNLQRVRDGWKMPTPIIQDGKVLFTAPDGEKIHCLDLFTGDSLWQVNRHKGVDLYLAGIFNGKVVIIGKDKARALSLADGKKELWHVDLEGLPSGLGVAVGSSFYLPLRVDRPEKHGEIWKISLDKGTIEARLATAGKEVPGNLLFSGGKVISQNETAVYCYPQGQAK
jgi:outer membrane protein assembly factor BamB